MFTSKCRLVYQNHFSNELLINPFSTNVLLLYPLKTSENRGFSEAFRGYRSRKLIENGLRRLTGKKYPQVKLKRFQKVLTI